MSKVNKTIKILLYFLLIINTAAALWAPLFSVFALENIAGVTLAVIGIMSAVYSITKSVLQIPIARYLDSQAGERDDFIVIFIGILLASAASFSLLILNKVWELSVIQVIWGVADACTMAAYFAIFSHHIDKKSAAFEWSLYSVGGITIGGAIGGLFGGFIAQVYGFPFLFWIAGIMNVVALFLLIILYPHLKVMRPKIEEK